MASHISTRWGGDESNVSVKRMREILRELDVDDVDHPSVSLMRESEWCLDAYPGGLLVWENLEDGEPRHMNDVSRERVLELWIQLSTGNLGAIESEPWLPGYGDAV